VEVRTHPAVPNYPQCSKTPRDRGVESSGNSRGRRTAGGIPPMINTRSRALSHHPPTLVRVNLILGALI